MITYKYLTNLYLFGNIWTSLDFFIYINKKIMKIVNVFIFIILIISFFSCKKEKFPCPYVDPAVRIQVVFPSGAGSYKYSYCVKGQPTFLGDPKTGPCTYSMAYFNCYSNDLYYVGQDVTGIMSRQDSTIDKANDCL